MNLACLGMLARLKNLGRGAIDLVQSRRLAEADKKQQA